MKAAKGDLISIYLNAWYFLCLSLFSMLLVSCSGTAAKEWANIEKEFQNPPNSARAFCPYDSPLLPSGLLGPVQIISRSE